MISPHLVCFEVEASILYLASTSKQCFARVMLLTMLGIRNRYGDGMTDPGPGADDVPALDAAQLEKAGLITRGPSLADDRATLVSITDSGRALLGRVMPGHILVTRRLLLDPLSQDDLHHLGDIMTRVRDHMRALPPRSAAPRKRRPPPASPAPDATQGCTEPPTAPACEAGALRDEFAGRVPSYPA